jgi:hypothetical protein
MNNLGQKPLSQRRRDDVTVVAVGIDLRQGRGGAGQDKCGEALDSHSHDLTHKFEAANITEHTSTHAPTLNTSTPATTPADLNIGATESTAKIKST